METTIHIQKSKIQISLHGATVIHANKYTEARGGWGSWPVWSNMYTDVVFRSRKTREDWPIKINYLDLPIYTDQEVMVISANNSIIGYIDEQTKKYYYTSSNLCSRMGFGMPYYLVWLIGILGGLVIGFVTWNTPIVYLLFLPLVLTWVYYWIQKQVIHRQMANAIDHFLQNE